MKDILGGLLMLVLVFGGGYCTDKTIWGARYGPNAGWKNSSRISTALA